VRVTVDRIPGSTVELDIYADDVEFSEAYEKALRRVSRDVTIPGFRKGKAPRHIIEKMVGHDAIVEEAGRDMMDDLYRQAIEQENLVPVGDPRVGILQAEPLAFTVTIEVFPTVTLGDYANVRVEPREVELEDSDVQEVLDQLQRQHSEWVSVAEPRAPRDDDKIVIDLGVFDGDEPFQEPAEDAEFILGESSLFEALVESIKMMQPGSTAELTLAFDDDDMSVNPALRGKSLRYVITLKDVQARVRPELGDDLAAKVGQFDSFDALREQIEKDLLRNKAMEARSEIGTEVINAMSDVAEIDVPGSMVEKELEDEITQFRSRLAQQGLNLDEYLSVNNQTMDELRDEMRPNAERRVRNSVVLQEIAKAEGVEVTAEDIGAEIDRLAGGSESPDRLKTLYESEYFRGLLENELFDRKLTERVISIATEGRGAVTGAGAEALARELGGAAATVEDDVPETAEADDAQAIEPTEPDSEVASESAGAHDVDDKPADEDGEDEQG